MIIISEQDLQPVETFYFYDQPLIFTAKILGAVRLLIVASDSRDHTSWRVATPDAQTVRDMAEDRIPVRDAYAKGPFFRIDWARGGELTVQEIDQIEPENLSDEGVLLHLDADQVRKGVAAAEPGVA